MKRINNATRDFVEHERFFSIHCVDEVVLLRAEQPRSIKVVID